VQVAEIFFLPEWGEVVVPTCVR